MVGLTNFCLSWPSQVGATYQVQGGTAIVDVAWTNLTGLMVATNTSMSHCIPRPTPYQFFQILEFTGATNEPPPEPGITSLEAGVALTNTVAAEAVDYYVFNVTPTAVLAEFEASPVGGDIGLILRYGLPLPDLSSTNAAFSSDSPGVTNELITVTSSSIPTVLSPGNWYLGVYNNSTNPVVYDVRASEVLSTNVNLIALTNSIPRSFTLPAGAGLTNFFLFKVLEPHPGVKFELYNLTGSADLLVAIDTTPSTTVNIIREPASPLQPVTLELLTNTISDVRGNWVLGVLNNQPSTNLSFTVRASYLGVTNLPPEDDILIDPGLDFTTNGLCFTWSSLVGAEYDLQGKIGIADPSWTNLLTVTATAPFTTECLPADTPYSFFQVMLMTNSVPSGGATNEVALYTPAVLADGRLQLVWDTQAGAEYEVQFATNLVPVIQWTTLTNLSPSGSTATLTDPDEVTNSVMRFYRILQR